MTFFADNVAHEVAEGIAVLWSPRWGWMVVDERDGLTVRVVAYEHHHREEPVLADGEMYYRISKWVSK